MIAILETDNKEHLGFILFSTTDNNCIFQILPKNEEVFDTDIYKKINTYNDKVERHYKFSDSLLEINWKTFSDIFIKLKDKQWILEFNDDSNLKAYVLIKE